MITFKFISLYLIPVITVISIMTLYAISYGKYSESTFTSMALIILLLGILFSSILSWDLCSYILKKKEVFNSLLYYGFFILITIAFIIELSIFIAAIYITRNPI